MDLSKSEWQTIVAALLIAAAEQRQSAADVREFPRGHVDGPSAAPALIKQFEQQADECARLARHLIQVTQ